VNGASGAGVGRAALDVARSATIAVPPALVASWLVVRQGAPAEAVWVLGLSLVVSIALAWRARRGVARRLRTLSSVLASFREGDFSIRARTARGDALVDEALSELNQLGDVLREHRLGELEAWALLRRVLAEVDVAVLAFNDERRLRLLNDAAAKAVGKPAADILGDDAGALGLADLLEGEAPRIVRDTAALGPGPWELRRGAFRLVGEAHTLVVLSDVRGALREQEQEAWKRLIRVMGHEINNSLAPIQSISQNLRSILARPELPDDWKPDTQSGLEVIGRRAEALGRFMTAYAQLARLPSPRFSRIDVAEWVGRSAKLEQRVAVEIVSGPDIAIVGDPDQLDQLLINLVKNAADASLETRGGVRVRWSVADGKLDLIVEDDGPGVSDTANLFVPFFTTKAGGSGIGLALARQIAEAHGGEALLRDRVGRPGAEAVVRLPVGS